jgi:hypothetical protein
MNIKNLFKRKPKEDRSELTLKLDHNGNKFYMFGQFSKTLSNRYFNFIAALTEQEKLGARREIVEKMNSETIEALNKRDVSKALLIQTVMKAMINLEVTNDFVFEIASTLIILNDEPMDEINENYKAKKRELYNSDPYIKVFFCEIFMSYVNNIVTLKNTKELLSFLNSEKVKVTEKLYGDLMQVESSQQTSTMS